MVKKKKPPKKSRPRTMRRTEVRRVQKLAAERIALAKAEVGGSAARPLVVESAAIVESRAYGLGCAVCAGVLRGFAHDAVTVDGVALRRVQSGCVECNTERETWVQIVVPRLN